MNTWGIVTAEELRAGIPPEMRAESWDRQRGSESHGTYRGAEKHRRDGTEVCGPCKAARRAYGRVARKQGKT